jgi:hypothetical protein
MPLLAAMAASLLGLVGLPSCSLVLDFSAPVPAGVDAAVGPSRTYSLDSLQKLDILVVVDDSTAGSTSLNTAVGTQIIDPMLPSLYPDPSRTDVQVAVIAADLGAGPTPITNCTAQGEGAAFHFTPPAGTGCVGPSVKPFLQVSPGGMMNFSGVSLGTEVACLSQFATAGCPIQQPLQAAYVALNGTVSTNAGSGFPRSDAALLVLFEQATEDASADPSGGLYTQTTYPAAYAGFGYGVDCGVCFPPTTLGTRAIGQCKAAASPQFLVAPAQARANLAGLPGVDPDRFMLASVSPSVNYPITVSTDATGALFEAGVCAVNGGTPSAVPSFRINEVLSEEGSHGLAGVTDVCAQGTAGVGAQLTPWVQSFMNLMCLPPGVINPATCKATIALGGQAPKALPSCLAPTQDAGVPADLGTLPDAAVNVDAGTPVGCFNIVQNDTRCGTSMSINVSSPIAIPAGSQLTVNCQ